MFLEKENIFTKNNFWVFPHCVGVDPSPMEVTKGYKVHEGTQLCAQEEMGLPRWSMVQKGGYGIPKVVNVTRTKIFELS